MKRGEKLQKIRHVRKEKKKTHLHLICAIERVVNDVNFKPAVDTGDANPPVWRETRVSLAIMLTIDITHVCKISQYSFTHR